MLWARRACKGGVIAARRQDQPKGSKLDAHASPWARGAEPRRLRFRGFGMRKDPLTGTFQAGVLTFFVFSLVLHGTLTILYPGDE